MGHAAHATSEGDVRSARRVRAAVLFGVPCVAALIVGVWTRPDLAWQARRARQTLFDGGDSFRRLEPRLSYAPADRHRPFSVPRDASPTRPLPSHAALAALERAGDRRGIAAAYALAGDLPRARQILTALPSSPDVESDLAAVMSQDPGLRLQALMHADRALAQAPGHPQATWNRAVLLETLGLERAAAGELNRVAARGEPGWGAEARARADVYSAAARAREQRAASAEAAMATFDQGQLPAGDAVKRYPDLARRLFYRTVRTNSARKDVDLVRLGGQLDSALGTTGLAAIARLAKQRPAGSVPLALTDFATIEQARGMQAEAALVGDPWRAVKALHLLGMAQRRAGDVEAARATFDQGLATCAAARAPELCIVLRLQLAHLHAERNQYKAARDLALRAWQEAREQGLPAATANALDQLLLIERLRTETNLARAYAEENAVSPAAACWTRHASRTHLADEARTQGRWDEAFAHLEKAEVCRNRPRFDPVGAYVLADLVRHGGRHAARAQQWLDQTLASYATVPLPPAQRLGLDLLQAHARWPRDRSGALTLVERVREQTAAHHEDEALERMRLFAHAELIEDALAQNQPARALELLAAAVRVQLPRRCAVGMTANRTRRLYLAAGANGNVRGLKREGIEATLGSETVPAEIVAALAGCPQVDVLATSPFLGRAQLLPADLPWGYLLNGRAVTAPPRTRLLVNDVRPPEHLKLDRLATFRVTRPRPGETWLQGPDATPSQVMAAARTADEVQLDVHGLVDREIADTAVLVLSPDADGNAFLTTRDVERTPLPHHPIVVLAACQAAVGARSQVLHASLPASFIKAGARLVLASPTPVEDAEAGAFFEGVLARVRAGQPAAIALRDERQAPRWRHNQRSWTQDVVLFR